MGVVSSSRIYVRKGGLISSVGVIAVGNCAPCLQLETTVSLSLVRAWRRKLSVRQKRNEGTKGAHCVAVCCTIQRCHVCLSVRPSVRIEQLGSHWTDFYEILYLRIFRKSVKKFKFD